MPYGFYKKSPTLLKSGSIFRKNLDKPSHPACFNGFILHPCPNCFKIEAENKEFKETLYWVAYALWRSKAFHPYLIGSVIPFIRIGDFKQVISEKLEVVKVHPAEFTRTIEKLRFIEIQENQLKKNLKLVQELKQAYVYRFFNP